MPIFLGHRTIARGTDRDRTKKLKHAPCPSAFWQLYTYFQVGVFREPRTRLTGLTEQIYHSARPPTSLAWVPSGRRRHAPGADAEPRRWMLHLAPYRNLRDRTLRGERMFVAEGRLLVERLLAGRFEAESLLVAEPLAAEFVDRAPESLPVYVVPETLLQSIIGVHLHQGVLAVGKRREEMSLEEILCRANCQSAANGTSANCPTTRLSLVICPATTDD